MKIEIFGPGCSKCKKMEEYAHEAIMKMQLESQNVTVEHHYDLQTMAQRGIMLTPALAIDGQVVVSGRVAGPNEIMEHIRKRMKK